MRYIQLVIFFLALGFQPALADHPVSGETGHGFMDVPPEMEKPRIGMKVFSDSMGGFNIHLQIKNFELEPPEFADTKPVAGIQGHAHLYINHKKIGRLYGPYFYVPAKAFEPGVNVLAVTINDHSHNTWRVDGKEIVVTALINPDAQNPVLSIHSPFPMK